MVDHPGPVRDAGRAAYAAELTAAQDETDLAIARQVHAAAERFMGCLAVVSTHMGATPEQAQAMRQDPELQAQAVGFVESVLATTVLRSEQEDTVASRAQTARSLAESRATQSGLQAHYEGMFSKGAGPRRRGRRQA